MPFCVSCGAQAKGAFCENCGAPVKAAEGAAASAPPPPMSPPAMSPPQQAYAAPGAVAPAPRKTSPIVWILVAVLGVFLLGAMAIAGIGFFVVHKARQAGIDPDLMRRNPGLAVSKLIAATNPDLEVLNINEGSGTITLRDKKDGKVVTLNFDDVKNGKFKMRATDENGQTATVEVGSGAVKLPSWIPEYPGAKAEGNFTARGDDGSGKGAGGMVSFSTSDSPSKVLDYYKDKVDGTGMKVVNITSSDAGGMIVAADDAEKRSLQVIVSRGSGSGSTIAITFGEKR